MNTLALGLGLVASMLAAAPAAITQPASTRSVRPDGVAGTVVDEDGAPVAGAKVIAVWPAAGGQDELRQFTTTAEDGAFSAYAPAGRGAANVSVFAKGLVFDALEQAEGDGLRIVGRHILEVAFDLRLPDGTAPENAMLRLEYPESTGLSPTVAPWRAASATVLGKSRHATVTVDAGLYDLPKAKRTRARWTSRPIVLDAGALESDTVRVDLVERRVLVIDLVGDEGRRLLGRPNLLLVIKASEFDEADLAASVVAARKALTPGRGMTWLQRSGRSWYGFSLEPGDYVAVYLRQGRYPGEWKRFTVSDGETRVPFEIEDAEARGRVTVQCVDANGEPLAVGPVRMRVERTGGSTAQLAPMEPLGPGAYTALRSELDPDGILSAPADPRKRVELIFRAPGLGSRIVELDDERDRYVVRFLPPIDLELLPTGPDWRSFYLRIEAEEIGYEGVFDLNETDTVKIEGVQPAVFTVDWVLPDRGRMLSMGTDRTFVYGDTIQSERVDGADGRERVTVRAPTPLRILVDATAFEAGDVIYLGRPWQAMTDVEREDALRRGVKLIPDSVTLDESRVATFEGLGPGRYRLHSGAWYRPLWIDVEADLSVTYPRVEARELLASIHDTAGSLAGSGLTGGDVIIGRDGARFTSLAPLQSLAADARDDVIEVTVRRGGTELELELGPLGVELGGFLEPHYEP